jgi:hypothetical protein
MYSNKFDPKPSNSKDQALTAPDSDMTESSGTKMIEPKDDKPPRKALAPKTFPSKTSTIKAYPSSSSAAPSKDIAPIMCLATQARFAPIARNTPTIVVPSSMHMFHALSLCDNLMATTPAFTNENASWIPYVSQAYVSVLFIYATLRAQAAAGAASHEQRHFLDLFERIHNPQTLMVPGPLVPFFQALAAASSYKANYGNITFGIRSEITVDSLQMYCWTDNCHVLLPHLPMILDQIIRTLLEPNNYAVDHSDNWYSNIFGIPTAPGALTSPLMLSPNARSNPLVTASHLRAFKERADIWANILPFNDLVDGSIFEEDNLGPLNIWQSLGMTSLPGEIPRTFDWFPYMSLVMQKYCQHFKHSVPIASISPLGIGSVYVCATFTLAETHTVMPNPIATRISRSDHVTQRFNNYPISDVAPFRSHPDESLEQLAEEYGILAVLHTNWNQIAHADVPVYATICQGPLANQPIARTSVPSHVYNMMPQVISNTYHSYTPI